MCPYSIYTRTVLLSIMLLMKILSCWTYISPIILCCFRVWVLRFSSHSYIPYMYRICPMSNSTFTIYNGNNVWRGFVTSSVIILHLFWLSENVWRGFHYLWVFPYYVIRVVLSCSLFSFFLFILYFCKSLLLSNKFFLEWFILIWCIHRFLFSIHFIFYMYYFYLVSTCIVFIYIGNNVWRGFCYLDYFHTLSIFLWFILCYLLLQLYIVYLYCHVLPYLSSFSNYPTWYILYSLQPLIYLFSIIFSSSYFPHSCSTFTCPIPFSFRILSFLESSSISIYPHTFHFFLLSMLRYITYIFLSHIPFLC